MEASAQDDVLDLFDMVVTRLFADAEPQSRKARLRHLRDLDAAALPCAMLWALVLGRTADAEAISARAVFAAVPRDALEAAMAAVDGLPGPPTIPTSPNCATSTGACAASCPR